MAQCRLNVLMEDSLKHDAEKLFNRMGLSLSTAVNAFFRQALREQAMPFELKPYDPYLMGENLKRITESVEQANAGQVITFSLSELEAMEDGEVPERGLEFLKARSTAND